MLIRGQSTEDRIRQIAEGFSKGLGAYSAGQSRYNDAAKEQQRYEEAQALRDEAQKRQDALKSVEVANSLSERSGKIITPDQVSPMLKSGDFTGLGDLFKNAEASPKYQREVERQKLQDDLTRSQITKNNQVTAKPAPLSYGEKLDLKLQKEAEAKAKEQQNPVYKLEKLGAEGRSKVGAIASGFQALDQMIKSSDDGFKPSYVDANTPGIGAIVSDNPYTEGERMLSEVIGRLQSGGAINDQEIKTFRSLGPRPGDDAKSRTRKLAQQRDFLKNKLTAFGLSGDDLSNLGFETSSRYVPKNAQTPVNQGASSSPLRAELEQLRALKASRQAGG